MAPPIKNDSEGKALIIAALEKSGDVDLAKWLEGNSDRFSDLVIFTVPGSSGGHF